VPFLQRWWFLSVYTVSALWVFTADAPFWVRVIGIPTFLFRLLIRQDPMLWAVTAHLMEREMRQDHDPNVLDTYAEMSRWLKDTAEARSPGVIRRCWEERKRLTEESAR
jgi:hypothetical protein